MSKKHGLVCMILDLANGSQLRKKEKKNYLNVVLFSFLKKNNLI